VANFVADVLYNYSCMWLVIGWWMASVYYYYYYYLLLLVLVLVLFIYYYYYYFGCDTISLFSLLPLLLLFLFLLLLLLWRTSRSVRRAHWPAAGPRLPQRGQSARRRQHWKLHNRRRFGTGPLLQLRRYVLLFSFRFVDSRGTLIYLFIFYASIQCRYALIQCR
jgi:hypothetical protein